MHLNSSSYKEGTKTLEFALGSPVCLAVKTNLALNKMQKMYFSREAFNPERLAGILPFDKF